MSNQASELLYIIQKAQGELEELRLKCKHKTYTLGYWSWRVGCKQPARICAKCMDIIDYLEIATDREEYEYVEKNNGFYNEKPRERKINN